MAELSRTEQILKYGLGEVDTLPPNLSRIEELLVKLIEQGGSGGGSGTTNYNALSNKPSIAGITLQGNLTFSELGVQENIPAMTQNEYDALEVKTAPYYFIIEDEETPVVENISANSVSQGLHFDGFTVPDEEVELYGYNGEES